MNCRNFETIITELAREQMLEAGTRENALAHLESCNYCAARFKDEQSLTAGLRAVAANAALAEAPARVEAALLSAFRQGTTMSPADRFAQLKTPRWSPWAIAAAATILVVSAFAILQFLTTNAHESGQQASTAQPQSVSSPTVVESAGQSDPEERPLPVAENPGQRFVPPSAFPRPIDRRRGLLHEASVRGRTIPGASNFATATSATQEIATDFLPLTYGSNLSQLDEGQVVRIELPRSVLQSFGLPINAERAGERVKADVLIGHDGVARAIRFVK